MATQGKARSKTTAKKAAKAPPRGPKLDARGLNPRQARFVDEYLIDLNGTQAAIRSGYSKNTAAEQASDLLRHPKIAAAVAAGQARRSKRTEISQDRVLQELAKIAFVDVRKAVRWGRSPIGDNGIGKYPVELIPSEEIDDDTAAAVAEVSLTETGIKVKFHDKRAALVDLGKHLGLFVERVKIDNPEDIARAIAAAQSAIDSSGAFPAPPAAEKAA